jgi:toxin ParE1/3/4
VTRLPFHPEARTEFREAVAWHEREHAGFGALLIEAVIDRVGQAARFPQSGRPVSGFDEDYDVRLFAVRRFRSVVVTALVAGERKVIAVAHTSRRPGYWRDRLK